MLGSRRTSLFAALGLLLAAGTAGAAPMLTVAPNKLDFGNGNGPLAVTITNAGDAAANLLEVTFSGPEANSFAVSGNKTGPIPPNGGTLVIQIVAVPLLLGLNTATLTLHFDDQMNPSASLPLSANAGGGSAVVNPKLLDFGVLPILTASAPQTLTLSNAGNAILTLLDLEVDSPYAPDFNITNPPTTPVLIPPLGQLSFDVVFTPSRTGLETGSIDFTTDDPNAKLLKVPIQGGGSQVPTVMPQSIDFGMVILGASAVTKTVTYTNLTGAAVVLQSITIGGADATSFTNDHGRGVTVAAGSSLAIGVTFAPRKLGTLFASLVIQPMTLPAITVSLVGTGVQLPFAAMPDTLDFGDVTVGGTSAASTVTIQNNGNLTLPLGDITSSGGQFMIDRSQTAATIPPGGTTTFALSFHPSLVGADEETISVLAMGSDVPATVAAQGTGTPIDVQPMLAPGCSCSLSPRVPSAWPLVLLLLGLAVRRATRRT